MKITRNKGFNSRLGRNAELDYNLTRLETLLGPYQVKEVQASASYAQQCYSLDIAGSLECGTFVKKRLNSIINTAAPCPFTESICRSSDANLLIDTGYLDTNDHFGLNAPPDQRLQHRRVIQCAPIVTEGHKTLSNLTSDRSYTRYWYGEPTRDPTRNFTYEYSNDDLWLSKTLNMGGAMIDDYRLRLVSANKGL